MSLIEQLKKQDLTISFAESMTGGALASYITSMQGASNVFKGSLVCYDTEIKTRVLGISKALIDTYQVVSKEVCLAMAEACQALFKTHLAISVTGYADGKENDIYIGIKETETTIYHLVRKEQTRQEMIQEVVHFVYDKIQERLLIV
jgi:nicotinamide-nucleotide amidase